jgi:uridine kinase
MSGPCLLVISGPIASGKSTAAQLLARRSRGSGRPATAVDLDCLYLMLEDTSPMADSDTRHCSSADQVTDKLS